MTDCIRLGVTQQSLPILLKLSQHVDVPDVFLIGCRVPRIWKIHPPPPMCLHTAILVHKGGSLIAFRSMIMWTCSDDHVFRFLADSLVGSLIFSSALK
jgi:hypothetical protein